MGVGFEVSNWYLTKRAMQNAADAAVIAAADNGGSNYDVEAKAVAAQYGFVNGSAKVTVTVSNKAVCPYTADVADGNTCYSVTITKCVPLYLSKVVGYKGDCTWAPKPAGTSVMKTMKAVLFLILLSSAAAGRGGIE